jgi:hypothetical protein
MRRTTRNVLITAAGLASIVALNPLASPAASLQAGACRICDIAGDAADNLVGGIVPDPLKKYSGVPGGVIRGVGNTACSSGAGGGPIPKQVDQVKQAACNAG